MSIIQTDINWMRTVAAPTPPLNTSDLYYCMNIGMEGFWRYKGVDTSSEDNTGLTLTNPQFPSSGANRHVFARVYDDYICANWFGTIGDDATDNTNQIQLAVNAMLKISGGTLYFRRGIYRTGTISIQSSTLTNRDKLTIKGAGRMSTIFKGINRLEQAGFIKTELPANVGIPNPLNQPTVPIFDVIESLTGNASAFLSFNELTVIGNYEVGNYLNAELGNEVYYIDCEYTYDGISTAKQTNFELANIEIKGCNTCFIGNGSLNFHIHDFLFGGVVKYGNAPLDRSNYGIRLEDSGDGTMAANAIRITDGSISCCLINALTFTRGNQLNVSKVAFEINGTTGQTNSGAIFVDRKLNDSVIYGNYVSILNIDGCWFEQNEGYTILLNDPISNEDIDNILINITGCFFAYMDNTNSNGVYLGLIPNLPNNYDSYISKVNIIGSTSKLPRFIIKSLETVSLGSFIENLIVNGTATIPINIPNYTSNKNYLFEN